MKDEQKRAYMQEWRKKNREKIRKYEVEYQREYRKKYPEKARQYSRTYRLKHYQKSLESARQQYYKHHEKRLQYSKSYFGRHKTNPAYITHRRERYKEYMQIRHSLWQGNINGNDVWRKAQFEIAPHIIAEEGFVNIIHFPQTLSAIRPRAISVGWYDLMGKREGKIYAFEVTVQDDKQLRPIALTMARYLGLEYVVLFIKPDLSQYYLMPITLSANDKRRRPTAVIPMKIIRSGMKPIHP